jgi:hypothetical protein
VGDAVWVVMVDAVWVVMVDASSGGAGLALFVDKTSEGARRLWNNQNLDYQPLHDSVTNVDTL